MTSNTDTKDDPITAFLEANRRNREAEEKLAKKRQKWREEKQRARDRKGEYGPSSH